MDTKIRDFLEKLEFNEKENEFIKYYNNYPIIVNKQNLKINYGNKIKNERETTTNLSHQDETMVVLECVDRLLKIGYSPDSIIL